MEITLEEIQKKFNELPDDIRWAIVDAKIDDNIIEIGGEQKLNIEQMGQLAAETYMVMLGFTHPDKFEDSVKKSLGLPGDKTRIVVNEVNERILRAAREKIMALYGGPKKEPGEKLAEEKREKEILNSAGIEIIEDASAGTTTVGEDKAGQKLSGDIHSILAQKLSAPVQNPVVKTEHSMENLTKPAVSTAPPTTPAGIMGNIKPDSKSMGNLSPSYTRGEDPYRMKPE